MESLEVYKPPTETTAPTGKDMETIEMSCCCVFFSPSLCPHIAMGAHVGQKRASEPLELGFKVVVSCPMWVLGTELGSSVSAAGSLYHRAISLACLVLNE